MEKMKKLVLLVAFIVIATTSCKKDKNDPDPTVPTLTTIALTNITPTSATGGGTINSDGGEEITATGLVFSNTNNMPTLSDSKTSSTTTSGTFISELIGLNSEKNYFVRAYAVNSVGTGYGNVVTFSTGNAVPEVRTLMITGTPQVGTVLTANYTYFDAESNPESGTVIQWYVANDTIGAAVTPITGATTKTYTVVAEQSKFIRVGVTPKSSVGASHGAELTSYWVGPIGAETVTFIYNGATVTYGVIKSSITGRKWLDRNLGAQRAATSYNDYQAFGHLFQWGRLADGHQLVEWTSRNSNSNKSATTTTQSTTDFPGNALFYYQTSFTNGDWRNSSNNNLWQKVDGHKGINDPCPDGWHVPNNAEWNAEIAGRGSSFVADVLKLTPAGRREGANGIIYSGGSYLDGGSAFYWSSTPFAANGHNFGSNYTFYTSKEDTIVEDFKYQDVSWRYNGGSCRCIKD